jgi:hypothetical protein
MGSWRKFRSSHTKHECAALEDRNLNPYLWHTVRYLFLKDLNLMNQNGAQRQHLRSKVFGTLWDMRQLHIAHRFYKPNDLRRCSIDYLNSGLT